MSKCSLMCKKNHVTKSSPKVFHGLWLKAILEVSDQSSRNSTLTPLQLDVRCDCSDVPQEAACIPPRGAPKADKPCSLRLTQGKRCHVLAYVVDWFRKLSLCNLCPWSVFGVADFHRVTFCTSVHGQLFCT